VKRCSFSVKRLLQRRELVDYNYYLRTIFRARMSDDERRIFVGGLNYETDEATVRHYFSQYGPIADVRIVKFPPPDGRSKGFGFVRFGSLAAKEHCMSETSHIIDGKSIEIRQAEASHEPAGGRSGGGRFGSSGGGGGGGVGGPLLEALEPENVAFRRLFVGNVDHAWDEEVLREYFQQIGDIQELTIKRGPDGKCLGFAFMTFRTAADVDRIQQSRPHSVQGRNLETRRQTPKQYVGTPEAKLQVKKIWIGAPEDEKGKRGHSGLGDNTSDEDLEKYFSEFGTVTKVNQLMWVDTKKKRGYGYIDFSDTDTVDKVVLSRIHVVNGVRLEVKKAVTRQPGEKGGSSGTGMGAGAMMGGYNMGGSGYGGMGGMGMMGGGMMSGGMGMMDGSSMYGGGSGMGSMSSGWGAGGAADPRANTRKRGFESSR
jgi:RNA recognition motif-containing protein